MLDKLCRLCAREKENGVNIYEDDGVKQKLSTKIIQCLQIRVFPEDYLPKMVCDDCCNKLNLSSEFFDTCSKAQKLLQMALETQKGMSGDAFLQLQNPEDSKDFADSLLFESTNDTGIKYPLNELKEDSKEKFKIKKTKSYMSKLKIHKKAYKKTEKSEEKDKRVRLEDCYTWQCTDCPVVLASLQELKEHHIDVHSQSVRYQCIECAKVYAVYNKFTRHVRLHRNHGKYRCDECSKSFSSKQAMENHSVLHTGARPHSCTDCGKAFRQIGSLYSHRRIHQTDQRGFSCSSCGKLLLSQKLLEQHRKSHTGTRDYTCDICGKSFAVKQGLAYHMMFHSGERPHCCQLCGKRCKTLYLLKKHMAIHSNMKAHQCDVCGKQFREGSTLKLHSRIHTGAMPYCCEFCGRKFRFQGVYVIHRRQHTGERPYSCSECKRDFTNWANYNKHIKSQHEKKLNNSDKHIENVLHGVLNSASPAVKPHMRAQVQYDTSVPAKPDNMLGSLCPTQDNHKIKFVSEEQYENSQLYSQVISGINLTNYCFSSNMGQEYTGIDGLNH